MTKTPEDPNFLGEHDDSEDDLWKDALEDVESDQRLPGVIIRGEALDYVRETARITGNSLNNEIKRDLAIGRQVTKVWEQGGRVLYEDKNGDISEVERDFPLEGTIKPKRKFFGFGH